MNHTLPLIIDDFKLASNLFYEINRIVDMNETFCQTILTSLQTSHLMEHVTESLAGPLEF